MFLCFRYDEAPLEQKPYRLKDGALLAVGTLCDKLRQNEPYKSNLENMLVQHVFPEFSSPAGHLRAKVLLTAFGCLFIIITVKQIISLFIIIYTCA